MEPKKNLTFVQVWQKALEGRLFKIKISISLALLIGCAVTAPIVFRFIQQRDGEVLNDYILNRLPAVNLSIWIFTILYGLIFVSFLILLKNPGRFMIAIQAYILLTFFRFITLLLTPLEAPVNMVELNDPLVQHFFYQQPITKDLFFSGHTSLLTLLTLIVPNRKYFTIFLVGMIAIGLMLLFQHAHYTIDVLAAPAFAYLALYVSKLINKEVVM